MSESGAKPRRTKVWLALYALARRFVAILCLARRVAKFEALEFVQQPRTAARPFFANPWQKIVKTW
jgi:hypothetical protein